MKIGQLARETGIKVETIRYYEKVGLLRSPERTSGNYRDYSVQDLKRLSFIRHARRLGFLVEDVRSLLDLADERGAASAGAEQIAAKHLVAVEDKLARLERLRSQLINVTRQNQSGLMAELDIVKSLSDLGTENQF